MSVIGYLLSLGRSVQRSLPPSQYFLPLLLATFETFPPPLSRLDWSPETHSSLEHA